MSSNKLQKSESVGLGGDLDDVEMLMDFEKTFGISILHEETEIFDSLSKAHEIICSKLPLDQKRQGKCLTAMAYYRLNKALCSHGKLPPTTQLEVPADQTPKSFQKQLEERSDLRLDFLTVPSPLVVFLCILQFITWITAFFIFSGLVAVLGGILIAAFNHTLFRMTNASDKRVWMFKGTLGDLSQLASEKNFGKLVALGGKWTETKVWKTMTSIIYETTGFPENDMTPEMKFFG